MAYLYDKLKNYRDSEAYPFHMPGHKRNVEMSDLPFGIDITEIDGFDNLHHAEGILKEAQERAADFYGADQTFFSVNGSTACILSAISACTRKGGKILVARNCHKAVYHSIFLRELEAVYLYPQIEGTYGLNGGILVEDVESALQADSEIRAVVITSPTYDGVVSDVEKIAEVVHACGKILIVDEAHGAHFTMSDFFPKSALKCGADIVIHSVHKTMLSMTQTALLHVKGTRVDCDRLQRYMGIYQTSSPSYVLMASIDECVRAMQENGQELFESFIQHLKEFREAVKGLRNLRSVGSEVVGENAIFDFDLSKVVISGRDAGMTGDEICEWLRREKHLEMEMEAGSYALALTGVGDRREGFVRLAEALAELDGTLEKKTETAKNRIPEEIALRNQVVMRISETEERAAKIVPLAESIGYVSAEFTYLYPPGIPLIVPGEKISGDFVEKVLQYKRQGLSIQGLADYEAETIRVICEER